MGMIFYAYHGVLPQEQRVGNRFQVDLAVVVDVEKATLTDSLEDTISYAHLHALVEEQMGIPSKLIEHVAGRIATAIGKQFPEVEHLTIKVTKLAPPIKGIMAGAAITLEKSFSH